MDYDPRRITYNGLLEIFWQSHRPTRQAWSRQYMNAVFYHDDRQRQVAMASRAAVEKIGREVKTEVAAAAPLPWQKTTTRSIFLSNTMT